MDRWEPVQNVIEFVSLMILSVQCMQEGGIKQRAQFGLDRKATQWLSHKQMTASLN